MIGYIVTIFLSAFLLFQVQPLIGKFILPWFGGGPAVWMACMLFFQGLLLFGYAYAHLTTALKSRRARAGVHLAVLALSLAALPIIPSAERWKPSTWDHPVENILLPLFATVGAPYLVLSTTGPLLQDWFARTHPGRSPYRLYALSNLGSFLALLSYPFLFEPMLPLRTQALAWSAGYVAFAALCGWRALQFARTGGAADAVPLRPENMTCQGVGTDCPQEGVQDYPSPKPTGGVLALWLLLPFAGSVALLATTNQLCQEVAVVPFLWVMPLAVYLLTFVICFEYPRLCIRNLPGIALLFAAAGLATWVLSRTTPPHLPFQILIYGVVLYFLCMSCHGELSRIKPATRHLTLYYLMIAAGGSLYALRRK